jgi:hypothetical protein
MILISYSPIPVQKEEKPGVLQSNATECKRGTVVGVRQRKKISEGHCMSIYSLVVYICMFVCTIVRVNRCVCMRDSVHVQVCRYIYVLEFTCVHVYVGKCACVHACKCVWVCTCAHV